MISVLLPTRGRPEKAARAIQSLLRQQPSRLEIIVGMDDDDPTRNEIPAFPGVRLSVAPRELTLNETINRLAREAKGDVFVTFTDDVMITADRWVERVDDALRQHPTATVFHLADPIHPGFAALPVVRRDMAERCGFMMAPWFPFWFGDTWWDEIGTMIGAKVEIDVGVIYPDGRGLTQNLRDLAFWAELFEATRPLRVKLATGILGAPPAGDRIAMCVAAVAHLRTPEFIHRWEAQADGPASPRYAEARRIAETMMADLRPANAPPTVLISVPNTGTWLGRTSAAVAGLGAFTSACGIQIGIAALEGSMISKQRNDMVETAINLGATHILFIDSDMVFPPDALVRLLRHNVDIVGAMYTKKNPPYEQLGRLLGPKPTDEVLAAGGLWEAGEMPGGFMLIRTDVFRKLGWPWYFETYRWPGATATEYLTSMLRGTLGTPVPDEVLASINGSPLASWLESVWAQEMRGTWRYGSEDLNFCREVRKAGFKIWADLDLTWQMKHIGLQEVSCQMPKVERAEAALAEAAD